MIGRVMDIPTWLAYVASYDFGPLDPSLLILHHTYKPTQADWRGLASMRAMQRYYAGLGWSSAPHIYVAPDGIWLFTPMHRIGVHAGSGNGSPGRWYSIGIEMVGDFDRQQPSGYVWDATKAVLGGLCKRLGVDPRRAINFHRDYSTKSCPGWSIGKEWVWGEVRAWMQTGDHSYWRALWGDKADYHHDWGIPTLWRQDAERFGPARSGELWADDGAIQWFAGGVIIYRKATGNAYGLFW